MFVRQLFENIQDARGLAQEFSPEEWLRIATYFMERKYGWGSGTDEVEDHPMGPNRTVVVGRMQRINRRVGRDQPNHTPQMWNLKAEQFGMDLPVRNPTWQEIYDHLEPRRTYNLPPGYEIEGSVSFTPQVGNTEETSAEAANWVQTDTESWSDFATLRSEYLVPWFDAAFESRESQFPERTENGNLTLWRAYITNRNNLTGAQIINLLTEDTSRLAQEIEQQGSITKDRVDRVLYQWLRSADNIWSNYQRRN